MSRASDGLFDLIVIGGGVNGAGVARDAAGRGQARGAKVLLLEARDLASGTSSASTKLIHGGLRYLEYYEFGLVREALGERGTLWSIAPHIIRPMRFVLPVTPRSMGIGMRPRWLLRAGLFLYDHIGRRAGLPATSTVDMRRHRAGEAIDPRIRYGLEYSDGWVDDARLVVLNAVDARRRGATILTRTPVTGVRREGATWAVETPDKTFRARALVNAAGPAVDEISALAGMSPEYGIRRVRGSHIIVPRLFEHDYSYIFQLPDTRIAFAIPYEDAFTLIGTTDEDHSGPLVDVSASDDEIAYLCEAASRYFRHPVTPASVVHSYAGVRALVEEGPKGRKAKPEAATRGYRLPLSDPEEGAPLLGIYGGKITSYRAVAEDAVDALADRLPALSGPAWTAHQPLPGGDFPRQAQGALIAELVAEYPFLSSLEATRIGRAYGLDAVLWLGDAKRREDLGRDFGAGLSEAEVAWLEREEWAETADDILWRRTKLGLHMSEPQQRALREHMGG